MPVLAITVGFALAMYLLLVRTRANVWVVALGGVLAESVAVGVLTGDRGSPLVAKILLLGAAIAIGGARRVIRDIVDDLEHLQADPIAIRADGVGMVEHLETLGFSAAPDGWQHFPSQGWDAISLQDGATNAFVISGDRGPAVEFNTLFDNGTSLITCTSGRDRTRRTVLRQCFPDATVADLLAEHRRVLERIETDGHPSPRHLAPEELTATMIKEEVDHAHAIGASILGSMSRELRRAHLDVGSALDRDGALDRLRRGAGE